MRSGYRGLLAAYVFSVIAAVALPGFSLWSSQRDHVAAESLATTERTLAQVDRLHHTFGEIQAAARRYVLANDQTQRARAEHLVVEAERELDALEKMLSHDSRQLEQFAALKTAVHERFAFVSEVFEARQKRGFEAALALAKSGAERNAETMRLVSAIGRLERVTLDDQMTDKAQITTRSTTALLVAAPLAIVVLTLFFRRAAAEIARRKRAEAVANEHARRDPLTGLPNRRALFERLTAALSGARRHDHQLALLYLDLDGFKAVNDRFGHSVGDEVLRDVAARIVARVRNEDEVARIGGDEFVVGPLVIKQASDASVVAMKLIEAINQPYEVSGGRASIGVSIGIALYPEHATTGQELIAVADAALYRAKSGGKRDFRLGPTDSFVPEEAALAS